MERQNVDSLLDVLLNSPNPAWQDDAAEALARCEDAIAAEAALLRAIESNLDESLKRTCAESLAQIWIRDNGATTKKVSRLVGMPREVVEAFLLAANKMP